jgi:HK97 family phage portal protein
VNRQAYPVTTPAAHQQGWFQRAITTVQQFLLVGPSPKVRDPQNAEARGGSSSGVEVNDQSALTISAFWACLQLKGGIVGAMPLGVLDGYGSDIHNPVTNVPLYRVLHESPNADQTPTDYWEFAAISMMLRGNHYARMIKDGGRLIGLEPIRPDIVSVRRGNFGEIRYRWSQGSESFDLTEEDVFHVRGFGGGPLGGLSTIGYARESLGHAIAADRAAGSMFRNGATPSGVLKFKDWLDPEKRKTAREDIEERFTGATNTGRPFILEGGSEWQSISMTADDAQLLQSRGWSVEDICRWFNMPPILVGHSDKQSSWGTGVEQVMLAFLKFSLAPMLVRIEQSIRKQLMTDADRSRGLFAKFNMEGLLRGDSQGRAQFYHYGIADGWLTRNEARSKENLPPVEGGDVITIQSQNIALEEAVRQAVRDALKNGPGGQQ